jgi:hypothetical protein
MQPCACHLYHIPGSLRPPVRGLVAMLPWKATHCHMSRCGGAFARTLFRAADGARSGVLDFGGTSDVLFVGDAGTVAFERVTVAGFAPANGRGSPIADSVFWPSVQLAPGATVSRVDARMKVVPKVSRTGDHALSHEHAGAPSADLWIHSNGSMASLQTDGAPCMVQITFDSVELRYQRGHEYADCGAYQVCMGSRDVHHCCARSYWLFEALHAVASLLTPCIPRTAGQPHGQAGSSVRQHRGGPEVGRPAAGWHWDGLDAAAAGFIWADHRVRMHTVAWSATPATLDSIADPPCSLIVDKTSGLHALTHTSVASLLQVSQHSGSEHHIHLCFGGGSLR